VGVALALSLAASAAAGPYEDGLAAEKGGDYATAIRVWQPLAAQGDGRAQNGLGNLSLNGSGVPQDYAEAVRWYSLSANQGYAAGEFNLGMLYFNGHGEPQDYSLAARWLQKSASQGYADAEAAIGLMYALGKGVDKDSNLSVTWLRKAAEQQNGLAQAYLGYAYITGIGGVARDPVEAYRLLSLAISHLTTAQSAQRDQAVNVRALLAAGMTRAQLDEAQSPDSNQVAKVVSGTSGEVAPSSRTNGPAEEADPGAWTVDETRDPVTDEGRGIATVAGEGGSLSVKCDANGSKQPMYIQFTSDKFLGEGVNAYRPLLLRFGNQIPQELYWHYGGNFAQFDDDAKVISLLKQLVDANKLVIRATDFEGNDVTVVLSVSHAKGALERAYKACGQPLPW
jgi:hypothetical protein